MRPSKVYFKGLNGLRFISAFLVLMFHAETVRAKYSLFNLTDFTLFSNGPLAVEFFFVLSGFLITYLLLAEQANTGTINIKHFYMRRILRIWPLYYLILIIGLLCIPFAIKLLHIDYEFHYPMSVAAPLFVFFLPNVVLSIYGSSYLAPLWSIGVEEQFYFFWAPLIKKLRKYAVTIFFVIIALRLGFNAYYKHGDHSALPHWGRVLVTLGSTLKFEGMCIGALGAWLFYHHREKLFSGKAFGLGFQIFALLVLLIRLTFHNTLIALPGWGGTLYSVLFDGFYSSLITNVMFAWLILNISCNPKTIINTDNKVFNFLGNISYGIYMYHGMVLLITIILLKNTLRNMSPVLSTTVLYITSGGLTILAAYLTYRFVEARFLTYKKAFEPGSTEPVAKREKVIA